MLKEVLHKITGAYDTKYKQILIIPVIILLFSMGVIVNHYIQTGDFVSKGVSLKGGTMTRLEEDGSMTDVDFPKGEAVFREADPLGQFHRSANRTCKPIELIIIEWKQSQALTK